MRNVPVPDARSIDIATRSTSAVNRMILSFIRISFFFSAVNYLIFFTSNFWNKKIRGFLNLLLA